jgi:hypothetical protein
MDLYQLDKGSLFDCNASVNPAALNYTCSSNLNKLTRNIMAYFAFELGFLIQDANDPRRQREGQREDQEDGSGPFGCLQILTYRLGR